MSYSPNVQVPPNAPTPAPFHKEASPNELKSRLDWGEPALTIIDVRDREAFNSERILGAIPMPMDSLVEGAKANLEEDRRDIYIYGSDDQESELAATHLRESGFERVAELKGGLKGWKAVDGPTEGYGAVVVDPFKNTPTPLS